MERRQPGFVSEKTQGKIGRDFTICEPARTARVMKVYE